MGLESQGGGTKNVMERLRSFYARSSRLVVGFRENWRGETSILKKAREMQQSIETSSPEDIEHQLCSAVDRYFRKVEIIDISRGQTVYGTIENPAFYDEAADAVIAFLFLKARDRAAKPFNPDKELAQIRAVYHQLYQSDHVAMNTGAGKSSADIPIFTLVKTLLSPPNRAGGLITVPSSSDAGETEKLEGGINRFRDILTEAVKSSSLDEVKKSAVTIKLTTILTDADKKNLKPSGNPVADFFQQPPDYTVRSRQTGARIGFQPHDAVVFSTTNLHEALQDQLLFPDRYGNSQTPGKKAVVPNSETALKQTASVLRQTFPTYVMDEIHMAFEPPYITEPNRPEKTGKIDIDLGFRPHLQTLCDYVTLRLIESNVGGGDFILEGGRFYLNKNGEGKLSAFRRNARGLEKQIRQILTQEVVRSCNFQNKDWENTVVNYFYEFWDSENGLVKDYLHKAIQDDAIAADDSVDPVDWWLYNMAENYYNHTRQIKEGVDYITPDSLRDSLRGIPLPDRRFTEGVPFHLHAGKGTFTLPGEEKLVSQINFSTWLALVAQGKVIGLSNDLYYTDPENGKRELSPYGKILERYTKGSVIDLAPRNEVGQSFVVPQPEIVTGYSPLVEKVVLDVAARIQKEKRPELVVCWDEQTGDDLQKYFAGRGLRVALINSKMDDPEADKLQEGFANYEYDVLITTGRKSFAADFKDKKGEFTDFRVNIINPQTVFQIAQAFGRRRLEKHSEDFSIYFDTDFLLDLGTVLYKKQDFLSFSELSREYSFEDICGMVESYIGAAGSEPLNKKGREKLRKAIFDVLRKNQKKNIGDWEKQVDHEVLFIQQIVPRIKELKRQLFETVWRKSQFPLSGIIESRMAAALKENGVDNLTLIDRKALENRIMQQAMDSFSDIEVAVQSRYQQLLQMGLPYLSTMGIQNELSQQKWLLDEVDKLILEEFLPYWNGELKNPGAAYYTEELTGVIKDSLGLEVGILRFVNDGLKEKGIDPSRIRDRLVLMATEMHRDVSQPQSFPEVPPNCTETTGCFSQRFFDKNGVRYVRSDDGIYYPVGKVAVLEAKLVELNRHLIDGNTFKGKVSGRDFVDLYYPENGTVRFVRVLLK